MRPVRRLLGFIALLCFASIASADPLPFKFQGIVGGLKNPVYITSDGTPRLFICEQLGRVLLFKDGRLQKTPFLDITDHVAMDGEAGLLSIAFHPEFAKNGLFYVFYSTRNTPHRKLTSHLSEFHADPKSDTADPASERLLWSVEKPWSNHNGGCLQFGPDHYLYFGTGDGGSGGDPGNRAQNPRQFLGKMLRIDVDHRDGDLPYAIPKDNPFVDQPEYRPELWTIGMRNPWRFSFDRKTNELYCGDVGQDLYEEIDIIEKGKDYGWSIREGLHPFKSPPTPPLLPLTDPIKEYDHHVGKCIIGGYVYRGEAIPKLQGWYLYADYNLQWIAGLKYEAPKITDEFPPTQLSFEMPSPIEGRPAKHVLPQLSSFGEDADGELYGCDYAHGVILKIVPR